MYRSLISRTVFVVLTFAVLTSTGLAAMSATAQEREAILCSGLQDTIDLVMDNRGTLYTADRSTGSIFCHPPGDDPILFAQVPDAPTSLAVDKKRNVFVGTQNGTIFRISLDGSVSEIHRCQASPVGIVIDRDGDLIIATLGGDIIRVKHTDSSWLQ